MAPWPDRTGYLVWQPGTTAATPWRPQSGAHVLAGATSRGSAAACTTGLRALAAYLAHAGSEAVAFGARGFAATSLVQRSGLGGASRGARHHRLADQHLDDVAMLAVRRAALGRAAILSRVPVAVFSALQPAEGAAGRVAAAMASALLVAVSIPDILAAVKRGLAAAGPAGQRGQALVQRGVRAVRKTGRVFHGRIGCSPIRQANARRADQANSKSQSELHLDPPFSSMNSDAAGKPGNSVKTDRPATIGTINNSCRPLQPSRSSVFGGTRKTGPFCRA